MGERSAGKRSLVKHSDIKQGTVTVGETVKVAWGKSRKLFGAIIVADNSFMSPMIPIQMSNRSTGSTTTSTDDFQFELGSPGAVTRQTSPEKVPQPQTSIGLAIEDLCPVFNN